MTRTAVIGAVAYLKGKQSEEDGEKEPGRNGRYENELRASEEIRIGDNIDLER